MILRPQRSTVAASPPCVRYAVTFAMFGFPFTPVRNPPTSPQPKFYSKVSLDGNVQFFDSGAWKLPYIWRGDRELEELQFYIMSTRLSGLRRSKEVRKA